MHLVDVDPLTGPHLLERWVEVDRACGEHEFGDRHTVHSAAEVRESVRLSEDRHEYVLGQDDDGAPVAAGHLTAPTRDNLHAVSLRLAVLPGHRRRGTGTLLLADLERRTRALGRTTVWVESDLSTKSLAATTAFATRLGYVAEQHNLRQDLDVDRAAPPLPAPDDGYVLRTTWDGVPPELLDQRAVLAARMSTDAPMGGLELEPEVWDADRVRRSFAIAAAQGRRVVETLALAPDGTVAGVTEVAVAEHTPDVAYQWDTLVLREHRGHGLGRRVKDANLAALRAELPGVRRVVTWNADSNGPMLAVNAAMGFEATGVLTEWQRHLDG